MRRILAILAFLSAPVWGQTPPPPCYPLINGVHPIAPRHIVGEQGQHVFWFCSVRGGPVQEHGFSCRHGQCSMQALQAVQQAIIGATAKVTAANAAWAQHVTYSCGDPVILAEQTPRGELCRERQALLQAYVPLWLRSAP